MNKTKTKFLSVGYLILACALFAGVNQAKAAVVFSNSAYNLPAITSSNFYDFTGLTFGTTNFSGTNGGGGGISYGEISLGATITRPGGSTFGGYWGGLVIDSGIYSGFTNLNGGGLVIIGSTNLGVINQGVAYINGTNMILVPSSYMNPPDQFGVDMTTYTNDFISTNALHHVGITNLPSDQTGNFSSSSNLITVTGPGSSWSNQWNVNVGFNTANNTLIISNGAAVFDGTGVLGNTVRSSNNTVVVTGSNSLWSNRESLYVGISGEGNRLEISNGGAVYAQNLTLGYDESSSNNAVTLSGANSQLIISGGTAITDIRRGVLTQEDGLFQTGNLIVTNSQADYVLKGGTAQVSSLSYNNGKDFVVGNASNSPGATLIGQGGQLKFAKNLYIGSNSAGNTMALSDGADVINLSGVLGDTASSVSNRVLVSGVETTWSNLESLTIGKNGAANQLNISNGGSVSGQSLSLGMNASSTNNLITLDGNFSSLVIGNTNASGFSDINRGTLRQNGGLFKTDTLIVTNTQGRYDFNSGTAEVLNTVYSNGTDFLIGTATNGSGATFNAKQGVHVFSQNLYVGSNSAANTLSISSGARFTNIMGVVGNSQASSNNQAVITGSNTVWNNRAELYVGFQSKGNFLVISNGARVENSNALIGSTTNASGNTVTVNGLNSRWISGSDLYLGFEGAQNVMNISTQGVVLNNFGFVGLSASSTGNVVNLTWGSVWYNDSDLYLGFQGAQNTLNVTMGSQVYSRYAVLGFDASSSGNKVLVSEWSMWTNRENLYVGYEGQGNSLTISNGGQVYNNHGLIGAGVSSSNNSVVVQGTNSLWRNRGDLNLGVAGSGNTLTILDGGVVSAENLFVGAYASSTNNLLNLSGASSQLIVTNAGGTGISDIRRGIFTQDGGYFATDRLLVTNQSGSYVFNGGTAVVSSTTISNGNVFNIGNGTDSAVYQANAGTHTFADGLQVQSNGVLIANGSVTANITNQIGGKIGGSGSIFGNIFNNGLVAPGNSPGTLNIIGNFTQSSTGTLLLEAIGTAPGQFDQLNITGVANLGGTVQIVSFGSSITLLGGDTLPFILAAGGINGSFATVINTGALTFNLTYTATGVTILVSESSYASNPALTPSQYSLASALQGVRNISTDADWVNTVRPQLNGLSTNDLQNAFNQLSPVFYQSMPQSQMAWMQNQFQNIRGRFDELHFGGQSGVSTRNLSLFDSRGERLLAGSGTMEITDTGKPLYTPTTREWDKNLGMFISGSGEFGNMDATSALNGYDFRTAGVTLGMDYQVSENIVAGVFGGYANTRTEQGASAGSSDADNGQGGIYASYFRKNTFLNVVAGGGYTSYETERPISIGALNRTATASPDGAQAFTMAEIGHDFEVGKLRLGPVAGFQYRYANVNQFTEQGAGALNLTVNERSLESIMSQAGVLISYQFKLGNVLLIPSASARWQHEFANTDEAMVARFSTLNSSTFTTQTTGPGANSALVNVGLSTFLTESISIFGAYNLETDAADYTVNGVNAGFSWQF